MGVMLRLLDAAPCPEIKGELLCCAYTPDGAFVVSGGWDGHMRLWETGAGMHLSALRIGDKPVSACSVAPDGKHLVSGGLDGLLAYWDALAHVRQSMFLAHGRPISGIVFGLDGVCVGTSSWDGTVSWWTSVREQKGNTFTGHRDIVAGLRLTPDGKNLVSWSHDSTVRLWDIGRGTQRSEMKGHQAKVYAGAISPDGKYAASGSQDGNLKLWDLQAGRAVASVRLDDEVVGCQFLLDGETLVAVDHFGRLTLHVLPGLGKVGELVTKIPATALALSPGSDQLALASSEGPVRLIAVEGIEAAPLHISARQSLQRRARGLQKLFGGTSLTYTYSCVCPACRESFELSVASPGQACNCLRCRRALRIACIAPAPDGK